MGSGVSAELDRDSAPSPEASIQRAVSVVSSQGERRGGKFASRSSSDDHAIRLDSQRERHVGVVREVCGDLSLGSERCVQRAVGAVSSEREVTAARNTGHNNLSISLKCQRIRFVVSAEVSGDGASIAELRIESAIGVVSSQGEVTTRDTGSHDLSIALDGHGPYGITAARYIGDDRSADAEGPVERAIRVVSGQREVFVGTGAGYTRSNDSTIGLDGQRTRLVIVTGNVRDDSSSVAEARVEICRRVNLT